MTGGWTDKLTDWLSEWLKAITPPYTTSISSGAPPEVFSYPPPTLKLKERLSSHHQARYKICMYAKRNKPWAYVSRPRMWMSVCLSVCSVPSVVIWHEGGCQMRRQDKWNGLCRKERKGRERIYSRVLSSTFDFNIRSHVASNCLYIRNLYNLYEEFVHRKQMQITVAAPGNPWGILCAALVNRN